MKVDELMLSGLSAAEHICWTHLQQQTPACSGNCGLAHVFGGACAKAVNAALGCRKGKKRCAGCARDHPTVETMKLELDRWWHCTHSDDAVWSVRPHTAQTRSALHGGERSANTASDASGLGQFAVYKTAFSRNTVR